MFSIDTKKLHALTDESLVTLNEKYLVQSVKKDDESGYQILYVYDAQGKEAFFHSMRKHRFPDRIEGDLLTFIKGNMSFNLTTRQWEPSSEPKKVNATLSVPEGYTLNQVNERNGPFCILRSKDGKLVVYLDQEGIIPVSVNPLSEIYSLGRDAFLLHSGFEGLSFLYNRQGKLLSNWYGSLIAAESCETWLSFALLHEKRQNNKLEWVRVYRG